MDTPIPTYIRLKNIVGGKKNWVTDYPSASTIGLVKSDTNLYGQEVLTVKYVGFQL
jgi:hypothetical protein